MNEFDTRVFDQLDDFTPEPAASPNWPDILHRARKSQLRRLVVALAATVAVLGSAAVVTAALGGFDAWLSGDPGKPAPKVAQQRFETANKQSLAGFPEGTKLRELIRAEVGGRHYALFGFRSGSSVCLRLDAIELRRRMGPACAPVSKLLRSPAPLLVVDAHDEFQNQHGRTGAVFSFGLIADGVSRVLAQAVDGRHRAFVGGNAYLWIQRQPNTGQRVLSLTAVRANGSQITVPVAKTFGRYALDAAPQRPPRGPSRVEARIKNPTIGWFVRGEWRGLSPEEVHGRPRPRNRDPGTQYVKPDPDSNVLLGLSGQWCLLLYRVGGDSIGCSSGREFWSGGPLNVMISAEADEFARVNGAVADGVERVVVFLAGGERQRAALRHNLFTALVAQDEFPVRVVAYDRLGRVVGVRTWRWGFGSTVPAGAARSLRQVARVTGPSGVEAVARIGRKVQGVRCWRVDFSTGQSPGGCLPQVVSSGPSMWVDLVQPAGRDMFVIGHASWPIERVRLEFANGRAVSARPVSGLFVAAIPRGQLRSDRQVAFAVGYTVPEGFRVKRAAFVFRTTS